MEVSQFQDVDVRLFSVRNHIRNIRIGGASTIASNDVGGFIAVSDGLHFKFESWGTSIVMR